MRDLPDPVTGKAISRLRLGVEMLVSEQTAEETVIDGTSARCYHITEPADGWVFGAYLD